MMRECSKKSVLCILISFALALISLPNNTAQAAGTVGNGTPGSCTEAALRDTIQGGGLITFNCGPNNHTITVTQELYFQAADATLDGGNKITLQGTPGVHIIRFQTLGLAGAAKTLTLKNLTIRDAFRQGDRQAANGAAVYVTNNSADYPNERPTLIVENVIFFNNVSVQTNAAVAGYDYGGGAIMVWGGSLIVRNSQFLNNRSDGGGGGAVHILSSDVVFENTLFRGNVTTTSNTTDLDSGWGGAFYVDGAHPNQGTITITNTTFEENFAGARGGVAYIDLYLHRNQSMVIDGSRFIGNRVENPSFATAGAITTNGININQGGRVDVTIMNSLFQDNVSRGNGANNPNSNNRGGEAGALRLAGQYTTIANTTFIGNRAEGECDNCWNASGGAMFVANTPGPVNIMNSVFANNYSGWIAAGINAGRGNVIVDNSIFYNNMSFFLGRQGNEVKSRSCREPMQGGTNNIQFPIADGEPLCRPDAQVTDPMFGDFQGNGVSLRVGSPAIDAGNSSVCASLPVGGVDVNGIPRPQGAGCDIGAVEVIFAVDVNDDGIISPTDAVQVINGIGSNDNTLDIDQNGVVDDNDVNLVIGAMGVTLD